MKLTTQKIQHTLTIPPESNGSRFDQVLAKLLPDYSRVLLQKWIKSGEITLNQRIVKPRAPVSGGETVIVQALLEPKAEWAAQPLPLNIVYEDGSLLVINKPPGLIVHPGSGNPDHTLLNALLYHIPELNLLPRAGIIHRLDKDTSGLLVIAKTLQAYNHLTKQLKARTVCREYQAIVSGALISGGTVNAPIARHPVHRKRMAIIETGRTAITHYRILAKYPAHTRLKVQLETGRTHQIRVHMAYIRHPIIGDPVYGERLRLPKGASPQLIEALRQFKRQALHADELSVTHPVTKDIMHWKIELPEDLQHLIDCLSSEKKQ